MHTGTSTYQIKFGAIFSYCGIVVNILLGLTYTPWMIRSIGRSDFGLYTLALSVITLFVFDFGLSSAVTRFVAKYLAEDKEIQVRNFLGLVYKLYFCLDLILVVLLTGVYFLIPFFYKELAPDELEKFKVIYIFSSVFSVVSFLFIPVNGILNAYEKFIQVKICDLFGKLLIVGAMSICLLLGYGLYALVLVHVGAGLIKIGAKLFCIRKFTTAKINFSYYNRQDLGEILSYSGWMTVVVLMQRCIFTIAPSILGMLVGAESIAYFGVAMTLEGYVYTFSSAVNGLFLPKVTRVTSKNSIDLLQLMIRVGRIQIFIVGLIIMGFLLFGRNFIQLWVGSDFNVSYYCVVLLIIPSFFHLPQEIASTAILTTNRVKFQALAFIAMAAINLILAFLFTPLWGVVGISASICIAYLVRTLGMNVIYHKILKIDICRFFKKTFFCMTFPMFLALAVGKGIDLLAPMTVSWTVLIVKGVLFTFCYGVIMYIVAMNRSEKDLVLSLLRVFPPLSSQK